MVQKKEKNNFSEKLNIHSAVDKNPQVTFAQKLILHELVNLAQTEGYVYASNGFFAEKYSCSITQISLFLTALKEKGMIQMEHGTSRKRKMYVNELKIFEEVAENNTEGKKQNTIGASRISFFQHIPKSWRTSKEMNEGIKKYLALHRERGRPLKKIQFEAQAQDLIKHSKGNLSEAIKIVEQSVMKGWNGFYPLAERLSPPRKQEPESLKNTDPSKYDNLEVHTCYVDEREIN